MRRPWAFRALMRLYPASFRNDYGDEMWRVFRERCRDGGAPWLATIADTLRSAAAAHWDLLRQDLRYTARTLRATPGFTATVILVAALGIGANTVAFSLADHVLLRPLPFAEPDALVALWQNQYKQGYGRMELSPANYRDWKAASRGFDGMAAHTGASVNLVGVGTPQRLEGAKVTAELLPLLGVAPALGRWFAPEDDRDGAPGTVLLSHRLWQAAFGGDPAVVGRRLTLDGESHTVIGVMPRGFAYPSRDVQLWQPMRFAPDAFEDRGNTYLRVVARLAPGVTVAQARAELDGIADQLARAFPADNADTRATVNPLRELLPRQSRALVLALSGAAACVLLIACLNLASLLLTRALARRKELTLRTALGAGRERLVRQLLTESLLLALGGGVLGVALAAAALPLLGRLVPSTLPVAAAPELDLRVLAAAAATTLLAGLGFGVLPALRACGQVDAQTLREGARGGVGARRQRLRRALVVAEVCISLVLLISSGLLLRALWRLQDRDPGFRPDGVLTLRTALPLPKYLKTADRMAFYDRVLDGARALPGVGGAAYTSFLPMVMGGGIWPVTVKGRPEDEKLTSSLRFATPDYFRVMGIPLLRGRPIAAGDTVEQEPWVAVVSESFARRYWPGEDAVGKTFFMAFAERRIVGVVGDIRVRGLEGESEPQVYLAPAQVPDGGLVYYAPKDLVIRAAVAPATLLPSLRAIVAAADPEQPIADVRTLREVVEQQTAPRRVQLAVLGCFAALAFLLAGIGIYGLLSFGVTHRSQEIGVRMALGATPRGIIAMVLREGLWLTAIGAALGVALAAAAGRSLEALLAGVTPTDAVTFAGALLLAFAATLAGSLVPAWRASRVDPARVMRAD